MNTQSLPEKLLSICDAAVEHAHGRGPLPKGLTKLQEWLEGDGWDELLAGWSDERMALKLQERPSGIFCDSELRAYEGREDNDEILDETRLAYARERINEWTEGDDGYINPSVHCCPIVGVCGQSAVLGYLVEIHGQGGRVPVYCGLFKDGESFYSHLREIGLVLSDETDDISDESILKLWEKPKPKRKPRAARSK